MMGNKMGILQFIKKTFFPGDLWDGDYQALNLIQDEKMKKHHLEMIAFHWKRLKFGNHEERLYALQGLGRNYSFVAWLFFDQNDIKHFFHFMKKGIYYEFESWIGSHPITDPAKKHTREYWLHDDLQHAMAINDTDMLTRQFEAYDYLFVPPEKMKKDNRNDYLWYALYRDTFRQHIADRDKVLEELMAKMKRPRKVSAEQKRLDENYLEMMNSIFHTHNQDTFNNTFQLMLENVGFANKDDYILGRHELTLELLLDCFMAHHNGLKIQRFHDDFLPQWLVEGIYGPQM